MIILEKSPMPVLQGMSSEGFLPLRRAVVPRSPNTNNVSVCCAPGRMNTGSLPFLLWIPPREGVYRIQQL